MRNGPLPFDMSETEIHRIRLPPLSVTSLSGYLDSLYRTHFFVTSPTDTTDFHYQMEESTQPLSLDLDVPGNTVLRRSDRHQ